MVWSGLLALLILLVAVPSALAAATPDGQVGVPMQVLVAMVIAGIAAVVALIVALTAPRPPADGDASHGSPEYAAGMAVVAAVALLVLGQVLPWGSLGLVGGQSIDTYPWGFSRDLAAGSDSGTWFAGEVDGAGHLDLKIAFILHYVALVALLPIAIWMWRGASDTKRSAQILAVVTLVHALAYALHMDGAAAAVNAEGFAPSWGGWISLAAVASLGTATLLVARFSTRLKPDPLPEAYPVGAAAGELQEPVHQGPRWSAGAPYPQTQQVSRWAGMQQAGPGWQPPVTQQEAPPARSPLQAPAEPESDLVRLKCPSCANVVEALRGIKPICPSCGFGRP
ncbi:MAG: hypothetical protein KY455_06455 [Euryarchaeota archaeon]|nr:hypothetical protein [Euryarchaeota archaeon]